MFSLGRNVFTLGFCLLIWTIYFPSESHSEDAIDYKPCGTLYSGERETGNKLTLNDFDQAVNLEKDFQSSKGGWKGTKSVKVEPRCTMTICSQTYFESGCRKLSSSKQFSRQLPANGIRSASCTCTRECKCTDVQKYLVPNDEWGRAYIKGGCSTCNAEYIELFQGAIIFPLEYYNTKIESVVLQKGCKIGKDFQLLFGSYVSNEDIMERFHLNIFTSVYYIQCDVSSTAPGSFSVSTKVTPIVEIPPSSTGLITMLSKNPKLKTHIGVHATLQSAKNGRSSKNAYILWIGAFSYYRENVLHGIFKDCRTDNSIVECAVLLDLGSLGISNSQMRLMVVDDDSKFEDDSVTFLATLDEYLSNHEDLKDRIPNFVILHHKLDDEHFDEDESLFRRKLQTMCTLQPRILDENFSNLIFFLDNFRFLDAAQQKNPEETTTAFENVIKEECPSLYTPIITVIADSEPPAVKVNGNWKMPNEEFFPKNFHDAMRIITGSGRDPMGNALIDAMINTNDKANIPTHKFQDWLPENHDKVEFYRRSLQSSEPADVLCSFKEQQRILQTQFATLSATLTSNTDNLCTRHRWKQIVSHCKLEKKFLRNFGQRNEKLHKIYPCRAYFGEKFVIGEYTLEKDACQIWSQGFQHELKENAEVLTISNKLNPCSNQADLGEYQLVSSYAIDNDQLQDGRAVPVTDHDSVPSYIAFSTLSTEKENNKYFTTDVIGTARVVGLNDNVIFETGNNEVHEQKFKVLACNANF